MEFEETRAYRAHAAHCINQSKMTKKKSLKRFWDELAVDWLALEQYSAANTLSVSALPRREEAEE